MKGPGGRGPGGVVRPSAAEAGRPLEVDAIGGAIVRAADRAGVDAPLTRALVAGLGG